MISDISARLRSRRPAYVPTDDEFAKLEEFFTANESAVGVYLFADGRIIECEEYRRRMSSRIAQLVAIQRDGFPVSVSRNSYKWGR